MRRSNGERPAIPTTSENRLETSEFGLTKRELFAALALQGLMSSKDGKNYCAEDAAAIAVEHADALLNELAGKGPQQS